MLLHAADMAQRVLTSIADIREELQTSWSPKFTLLQRLVRWCQAAKERLVVFSENLETLARVEDMLQVPLAHPPAAVKCQVLSPAQSLLRI